MFEIKRHPEAFSMPRQRRPRQRNDAHLDFIRGLVCAVCGKRPVDPAHLRAPNPSYGKRLTGMAEKPDDQWTTPLCRTHHDEQHDFGDEVEWWRTKGIDPFSLATRLYAVSGDDEAAMQIIREHRGQTI